MVYKKVKLDPAQFRRQTDARVRAEVRLDSTSYRDFTGRIEDHEAGLTKVRERLESRSTNGDARQ